MQLAMTKHGPGQATRVKQIYDLSGYACHLGACGTLTAPVTFLSPFSSLAFQDREEDQIVLGRRDVNLPLIMAAAVCMVVML
jgi:hypothetical protein